MGAARRDVRGMMYEVNLCYRGQCNYVVEAKDRNEAEAKARTRYAAGDNGDKLGTEKEEVDYLLIKELP